MIGSKENMLIVLVLLFSALWWSKSRKLLFILMTSLGLQVLFAGFIASGLFFAIKHNGGRDIYGQQREISSVAIQLWQMVHWKNIYWIVGIVALGFFQWRKQNFSFQKTDQHLFFLVVVLIVGYFSQVFFYGHFPYKSRYDFPGELFKYFAIYITVLFAWPLLADTMVRRINKYFIGITIIMVVLTIHRHLPASIKNVQINRGFATQLQQFVAYANSHAKQAIIFFTERIEWDIEPVVSVGRYLSFYQVVNPMMFHPLEPILPGSEKDTDLARQLEANYNKMVQEGGEELVPFNAQAMQNANCIGVVVKKAVTKWQPACEKFFSPW